jgi:hypothetical protein
MDTTFLKENLKTSGVSLPKEDISKYCSQEPPILPRQIYPEPCHLFVHPCGTPIDFTFSEEVLDSRVRYWTEIINVGVYAGRRPIRRELTLSVQCYGGRVVPISKAKDGYVIIVPDSRLWLPSKETIRHIEQETISISVVFEEWIELCLQRLYILPPIYTRIHMVSEYRRVTLSGMAYIKHVHRTASIETEDEVPISSNTKLLLEKSFYLTPKHIGIPGFRDRPERLKPLPFNLDGQDIVLGIYSLGSLWRQFPTKEWNNLCRAEYHLLYGSQNLFAGPKGCWPSFPAMPSWNLRGANVLAYKNFESQKECTKQWCSEIVKYNGVRGEKETP